MDMIDRSDRRTSRTADKKAFEDNASKLRTDGGEQIESNEAETGTTEDLPEPAREPNREDVASRTEGDVNGTEKSNGGVTERVDNSIRSIFDSMKPTSTFGRQSPSQESRQSHSQRMEAENGVDLEEASRAVDQFDADVGDWNKDRQEYELAMQKQRNEFESDLAESAKTLSDQIATVQKWAEKPLDTDMVYEADPNRGSHSFEGYQDMGLAGFVSALSDEAEEADQLYTHRQEQIAELGQELEQLRAEDVGIEDSEELSANNGLGSNSKKISEHEREAVESQRREVSEEIKMHREKKNEHQEDFVSYKEEVETSYRDHASEVGDYVADAVDNLQETTSMLEELSGTEIPVLEDELGHVAPEEVSGKILDDGEQEVRDEYRDAVNALAVQAAQQYSQIDNAVTELEEIEEGMNDEYFGGTMKSDKLRDRVDSVSGGQDYEQHLTETVNEALGDEYAASDNIRNVFRGIEPELQ